MATQSRISEGQQRSRLKAYKRSPALGNSTWYKGILISQMAGTADNNGAFDVLVSNMRRGTEPPPHVHSREDEFLYVLSGELRFYVDGEVFGAIAGECMFLPRDVPHAFLVASAEVHAIIFITPGGFLDAVSKMNAPAMRMQLPTDAGFKKPFPNPSLPFLDFRCAVGACGAATSHFSTSTGRPRTTIPPIPRGSLRKARTELLVKASDTIRRR